jgi:pyruvate,water dikinase
MGSAEPPFVVPLASHEAADPERFGAKAANLARLSHAGLPTPGGFCIDAAAYRYQLAALDIAPGDDRRAVIALRIALHDSPIAPAIRAPLLESLRTLAGPVAVRSSALVEDRFGASYAGQFESYLGLESEEEVETAVRACWAALWSSRVQRYMDARDASPAQTAMAVLIQPLVAARAAGGALSRTAEDELVINATAGLGASIAQGEVVPDRIVFSSDGKLRESARGRRYQPVGCKHGKSGARIFELDPCLDAEAAGALAVLVRRTEALMGMPVEVEWAMDQGGFRLLQARPLLHWIPDQSRVAASGMTSSAALAMAGPRLTGHPAGIGWGSGRACVVSCECELERVGPGDVLVTRVAGPALGRILSRVAGVVAELGGSTSHLASLARERGVPMVLGVLDATQRIPEGVHVSVDGVAGVVRWMR